MQKSTKILGGTFVLLAVVAIVIWIGVWQVQGSGKLTVAFLDIGQGDAIFIESPTGAQVLIDGGPNREVLRRLGEIVPWWDRTIDVVIPTHPDMDHVAGLIDVLERYRVSHVIQSSVVGDTDLWRTLETAIKNEGSNNLIARRGQVIDLGGGAHIEILFPDRSVAHVDTNAGCVVARLVYGATAFMFSCDAPQNIEDYLIRLDGKELKSNVLKAGHHGSRTSSSPLFVGFVSPEYAVFSRGCDNTYGHPHQEVVELFKRFEIPTFDTCEKGTVMFMSDGARVWRK